MGASSGFDCIVKVLVIKVVFLFFVGVLYGTCFVVGTAGQFHYWQTCSIKTRLIMIGTDSTDHLNCMNNNKIMHSIRNVLLSYSTSHYRSLDLEMSKMPRCLKPSELSE